MNRSSLCLDQNQNFLFIYFYFFNVSSFMTTCDTSLLRVICSSLLRLICSSPTSCYRLQIDTADELPHLIYLSNSLRLPLNPPLTASNPPSLSKIRSAFQISFQYLPPIPFSSESTSSIVVGGSHFVDAFYPPPPTTLSIVMEGEETRDVFWVQQAFNPAPLPLLSSLVFTSSYF